MYRRYWTERKYIDGVGTTEYRKIDELYDDKKYSTYEECMSGSTGGGSTGGDYGYNGSYDIKDQDFYKEYVNTPLTFKVLEQDYPSFKFNNITGYYSKNGGSWTYLTSGKYVDLKVGDVVSLKSSSSSALLGNSMGTTNIISLPNCELYGNIMSMYYNDDFADKYKAGNSYFTHWFYSTKVVDASNLILPTEMGEYCCSSMFRSCSLLEKAPKLFAETLNTGCYNEMFSMCKSLNEIHCFAVNNLDKVTFKSPYSPSINWVWNVPNEGIFITRKDKPFPIEYIPDGWTLITV